MSPPLRYLESCVPLAMSVLLERPVAEVAALLWRRGTISTAGDGAGGHQYGTNTTLACDVAMRLGFRIQKWNPSGDMFLSAPEFVRFVRTSTHREVVTIERPARIAPAPPPKPVDHVLRLETDPAPDTEPRLLTVRAWRSRHPCGRWLLTVHDGEALMHHALALIDGEIEAGGEQYRDAPIVQAFRVLPPKTFHHEGATK